ncbi:MAG: DNA polymerase III subunit gamma/tau [Actinomycetota bacterium]
MAYVSLYRKYRPQTFSEILGQSHVSTTLANAVDEGRVAHAYLLTGPRGTGKTSTARILAKALNCEEGPTSKPCGKCESCRAIAQGSSLDVIEMDAASHSKVEETREILTGVPLATAGGRRKVYVIDEVHMLTTQSFNALLKTLEEPPEHVVFVLATTEAHKVLPTIVSRTQRFDFRRVPVEEIEIHLAGVAKNESVDIEPDALGVIARHADGSVRDALSALDQLASLGGPVTAEDADRLLGERRTEALFELFDAIASGDVGSVFRGVNSLVSGGADPRQLALSALGHARSLLLLKTSPESASLLDVAAEDLPQLGAQSERLAASTLIGTLDLIAKAITEMRNSPNHRLLLEVALVRAASPDTDPSSGGLLARLERLERRIGIAAEPPQAAAEPPPQAAAREVVPVPSARAAPSAPQPEATPEPEPERSSTEGAAHVGLNHVRDSWGATLKEVNKRSKRVGAFLNPSAPIEFSGDALVVEVQSPFHRDAMGEDRNRAVLADAVHAALGIKPSVAFVERGAQASEAQPAPQEDASALAETDEDAVHDPVELVKRGLSAEVVEEREQ